jgi:hypothetical protein
MFVPLLRTPQPAKYPATTGRVCTVGGDGRGGAVQLAAMMSKRIQRVRFIEDGVYTEGAMLEGDTSQGQEAR